MPHPTRYSPSNPPTPRIGPDGMSCNPFNGSPMTESDCAAMQRIVDIGLDAARRMEISPRIGPDPRNAETQEIKPGDIPQEYFDQMLRAHRSMLNPPPVPGQPCPCCGQIVPLPDHGNEQETR